MKKAHPERRWRAIDKNELDAPVKYDGMVANVAAL